MTFDASSLKYDAQGLIPAIAQDHVSGQVLMLAYMNAQSIAHTLDTGQVTYWSRSRQAFGPKVKPRAMCSGWLSCELIAIAMRCCCGLIKMAPLATRTADRAFTRWLRRRVRRSPQTR